jgi:CHRD domain
MRKRTLAVVALAAAAIFAIGAVVAVAGSRSHVRASLTGYKEVPAISTMASGGFTATIGSDEIRYELRYRGLEGGPVLFAHIHLGRPATNGGVVAFLCGGGDKPACPQSGTVTGVIDPADVIGPAEQGIDPGEFRELVRAIKNGSAYTNVHTEAFPTGEIRGPVLDD